MKTGPQGAEGRLNGRRVTLDDVARAAGVHRTTVSQVLNSRTNCWASDATRARIRTAAEALGYRPNLAARGLRSGNTSVIGFVSPGFQAGAHSRPWGLTEAAAAAGYTVALSSHANDSDSEDLVIRRLLDRGVDGIAIYPVDTGPHLELRRLVEAGFPVVTFEGANLLDFSCDDVSSDQAAVGRLQARHLLDLGRRRLCLANAVPEARINAIREEALRREVDRAGLPPPLAMSVRRPADTEIPDPEPIEAGIRSYMETPHVFDSIVGHDFSASLALRVFLDLGVRVPEDVAVVGAGNSTLATYGAVPLTSVSTADDWAGARAFGLLLDRINGNTPQHFRRLVSEVELIVRGSTVRQASAAQAARERARASV